MGDTGSTDQPQAASIATLQVVPPTRDDAYNCPLYVAMQCASSDTVIRYTIDGGTPDLNSKVYNGLLTLRNATSKPVTRTVRARAFKSDKPLGDVITRSYVIRPAGSGPFGFYGAYCTEYAAWEFQKSAPSPGANWRGNAGAWYENAASAGWAVTRDPNLATVGSIIVWAKGVSGLGHVGIVRHISADHLTVQEQNWGGLFPGVPPGEGVTVNFGIPTEIVLSTRSLARGPSCPFAGFILPLRSRGPLARGKVVARTVIVDVAGDRVLGQFSTSTRGATHGFAFNGKTWKILDKPGAIETFPGGIVGDSITGYYLSEDRSSHGFLCDGKTWKTIDEPHGAGTRMGTVSGNTILGSFYDANSPDSAVLFHGCTYDITTTQWKIIDIPKAIGTAPVGISGDKIYGTLTFKSVGAHGFVYNTYDRTWKMLDVPGASDTMIMGADANTVVGTYIDNSTHGFIYDIPKQTWTTITIPGLNYVEPYGVRGRKVFGCTEAGIDRIVHGFIYDIDDRTWRILDVPMK